MDTSEAHRLAFLLGLNINRVSDDTDEFYSIMKSLANYSGIADYDLEKETIKQPHMISLILQEWGQSTLALMSMSGYNWSLLFDYATWLILDEEDRNQISNNKTLDWILDEIFTYINSNTSFFVLNYFFEFPVQDTLEQLMQDVSARIKKRKKKENIKDIPEKLFVCTSIINTLTSEGGIIRPERIQDNIDNRILLRSRFFSFLLLSPLILIIPPLIILIFLFSNTSFTIENILPALITFSGVFSILGIMLKLFYESMIPKMKKKVFTKDLMKLKIDLIFKNIFLQNKGTEQIPTIEVAMIRAISASGYPITKFFLTNREILNWKEYVKKAQRTI
ncbi:MAG: hypothetical protein HeimC3_09300 [Candidatus Heimdallarchaeota archaeon LC_3]|nr:MAG: hypothetical protein HeimC3_09300 [Candidatus Heimdallarchaeota archaeon LC_3]